MSNLSVIDCEGLLVVDSRLIAEELGIQHKNFLATLDKYEALKREALKKLWAEGGQEDE